MTQNNARAIDGWIQWTQGERLQTRLAFIHTDAAHQSSLKVRIVTSLYASVIIPGINPGSKYAFKRESGDSLAVSAIAILKK